MADKIEFHYIKNHNFRSILATGAYGGITPNGMVNMAFYVERSVIPQTVVHSIESGELGKEISESRVSKKGIIREVECNILMDLNSAMNLQKWLEKQIDVLKKLSTKADTK